MAKLVMGILGGFSGKVGTVVGSVWKGINTVRAYVANVTNPKSPAQLEQRAKFALIGQFLKPLTSFIRVGFKSQAVKMTASNAAMRYNLANAVMGVYPDYTIDYPSVKVTSGNLPGSLNGLADSAISGQVEFTWDDNSWDTGAAATDKAMMVVYNSAKGLSVSVTGGNTREEGSQVITLPASFSGDLVQCYLSFADANGANCSDSQFVGAVDVL